MRALTTEEQELINGGLIKPIEKIKRYIEHVISDIVSGRDHDQDCNGGGDGH